MSATSSPNNPRTDWIDAARGISILLVLLWHVFTIPSLFGVDVPRPISMVLLISSAFHIPTLFFISGLMLPRSIKSPTFTYVSKRLRSIAWPYIIWTLITCLALGVITELTNVWTWIGGIFHLWYLAVLAVCSAFALVGRLLPIWLLAASWASTYVLSGMLLDIDTNAVNRVLFFGTFVWAGAALGPVMMEEGEPPAWLLPLMILSSAAAATGGAEFFYAELDPSSFLVLIPLSSAFLLIIRKASGLNRLFSVCGRDSIVWFLVHFPPMFITARLAAVAAAPPWLTWLVTAISGVLACAFAVSFYHRFAWARVLFRLPSLRKSPND